MPLRPRRLDTGVMCVEAGRRCRVVVADDDVHMRSLLRATLERAHDFEVVGETGCGREALALVASSSPELLLLDLSMGSFDGFAVLAELRERRAATRVVVFTVHASAAKMARAAALGAAAYVCKDATPRELVDTLRSVTRCGARA